MLWAEHFFIFDLTRDSNQNEVIVFKFSNNLSDVNIYRLFVDNNQFAVPYFCLYLVKNCDTAETLNCGIFADDRKLTVLKPTFVEYLSVILRRIYHRKKVFLKSRLLNVAKNFLQFPIDLCYCQ